MKTRMGYERNYDCQSNRRTDQAVLNWHIAVRRIASIQRSASQRFRRP
jgi:hypothetical protein